jgi:hypothetical protein
MELVTMVLYLIGLVLSIVLIVAQLQMFAVRRLLEELVALTKAAGEPTTAVVVPPHLQPLQRRSIAEPPAAGEVYEQKKWRPLIIAAAIIVLFIIIVATVATNVAPHQR